MSFNVLIVDDSATSRAFVAKSLRAALVPINELHEASNGREALTVLSDRWIDLVLADINMPVMGGVEMIEKMAASGLLESVPVVIVSTEGSQTRIDNLRATGAADFLRKPFAPEKLRETVLKVLGACHDR